MKRFGEVIKDARLAKRLTLEAVAKAIRSHKGYISGIEHGQVNPPSPKIVAKLCAKLELPFEEMLALGWWEKRPKGLTLEAALLLLQKFQGEKTKAIVDAMPTAGAASPATPPLKAAAV
jgi:transcriptional regulator with XRE-family HTH domain